MEMGEELEVRVKVENVEVVMVMDGREVEVKEIRSVSASGMMIGSDIR